ncbi:HAD family hydrolase [uncultured Cohaesibacter sp.]|uniref:HAD-IIA family hydrolase n=1 Tax=uncultured Cohaesibacter sp. TaxID=1002546 RepID=UPI0029C869F8|nr:HAD family hydrolase [uncultured Cohaesibacter sp.]
MMDNYKSIFCDLDGCLISGDEALFGAKSFVQYCKSKLWVVSNNSSDTGVSLSEKLSRLGLEIAPDRLVLAGELSIRHLAQQCPGGKVSLYTDAPLCQLAEELGLRQTDDRPDIVLLARNRSFNLDSLERICRQLKQGSRFFVTNIDATHPGNHGEPVPETGALLSAVITCLPDARFTSFGKPDTALLDVAFERSGEAPEDSVFVGDNAETDGLAAARAGLDFIHITHAQFSSQPPRELHQETGVQPC